MTSALLPHIIALTMFAALMIWAAISDFRSHIIPNQISLGALALYPVFVMSAPEPVGWIGAAIMAAVFFGVGFLMFALRAMGAGDVKLITVAVLWTGPKGFGLFILVLAGAGLALAVVTAFRAVLAKRRAAAPPGEALAAETPASAVARVRGFLAEFRYIPLLKLDTPYGVAIAAAALTAAVNHAFTVLR
jgi:prepilin peptidase CpaA